MIRKRTRYTNMFNVHQQIVMDWLGAKGYAGYGLSDGFREYLKSRSGIADTATLGEAMNATLDKIGYASAGTLQDKLNKFYITKTAKQHPKDAELAFYSTFTLDFS